MRAVKRSHIGLKRKNNEDNCGIYEDLNLLAVADGMGGHMAGEVASKMALDLVEQFLRSGKDRFFATPQKMLKEAILQANREIYNQAQANENLYGMGTTITLAYVTDNSAIIAHIGDSRAYIISGPDILLLTSDHSLVNELLKNGGITSEEAKSHPQRNVLTRAMGASVKLEVDFYETKVKKGDYLLLCTDGLSNLLAPHEIAEVVINSTDLEAAADELVKQALDRGGNDNISLVLGMIT
ncbi:Stp1/IreP family PP2C-type Ser/Thr phosphatase [Thermincola potens]|uniref:Protein serine/threonine phosphatase n=1 Tax=Thermincola potens (strain JR) TaxID=635013 RepID=D5X7R9_THEPJ|nr:Stp1/IreP family PP2C-type Ser/Thr phosphatase [Thermincola potens]ADG82639.1 protein serine/threonine phosphatase [Thermincola potens JR]